MKKIMTFLLLCSMALSLSGCRSRGFEFANINEINDINCTVSTSIISGGIDNGSNDNSFKTAVIEGSAVKEAYNLISENCVLISEFNTEDEDRLLCLTFYSGDIYSAATRYDGITYFGSFVITKTGRFIAKNDPYADKSYYYQGDDDLYNKIANVVADYG